MTSTIYPLFEWPEWPGVNVFKWTINERRDLLNSFLAQQTSRLAHLYSFLELKPTEDPLSDLAAVSKAATPYFRSSGFRELETTSKFVGIYEPHLITHTRYELTEPGVGLAIDIGLVMARCFLSMDPSGSWGLSKTRNIRDFGRPALQFRARSFELGLFAQPVVCAGRTAESDSDKNEWTDLIAYLRKMHFADAPL